MNSLALLLLVLASAVAVHAQGLVEFINIDNAAGVNAPFYESDGVTKLSGSGFMAELLAGPSVVNLASIATTGFLSGPGAGYFQGGNQIVPGVPRGNTAWIEVRVWNTSSGASFLQAQASGLPNSWWQSSLFTVVAGGGAINPSPAAPLTGLGNSPVYLNSVPEPSALALFGLGAVLLLRKCLTTQGNE